MIITIHSPSRAAEIGLCPDARDWHETIKQCAERCGSPGLLKWRLFIQVPFVWWTQAEPYDGIKESFQRKIPIFAGLVDVSCLGRVLLSSGERRERRDGRDVGLGPGSSVAAGSNVENFTSAGYARTLFGKLRNWRITSSSSSGAAAQTSQRPTTCQS